MILRRQPPRITGEILLRLAPMLADLGDRAGAVTLLDQARRLHTALPDRATAQLDRLRRIERQLADPLRGVATRRDAVAKALDLGLIPSRW